MEIYVDRDALASAQSRLTDLTTKGCADKDRATEALAISAQIAQTKGQSDLSQACLDEMEAEARS